MKIIISGKAVASTLSTDEEITDPARLRKLDGLAYGKGRCAAYLDRSLTEIGLTGYVRMGHDFWEPESG